jgi:hypothetical protein
VTLYSVKKNPECFSLYSDYTAGWTFMVRFPKGQNFSLRHNDHSSHSVGTGVPFHGDEAAKA